MINANVQLKTMANQTAQEQRQHINEALKAAEALQTYTKSTVLKTNDELDLAVEEAVSLVDMANVSQALEGVVSNLTVAKHLSDQAGYETTEFLQTTESSFVRQITSITSALEQNRSHFTGIANKIGDVARAERLRQLLVLSTGLREESTELTKDLEANETSFISDVKTMSQKSHSEASHATQTLSTMLANQSRVLDRIANGTESLSVFLTAPDKPMQTVLARKTKSQQRIVNEGIRDINKTVVDMDATSIHFREKELENQRNNSESATREPHNLTAVRAVSLDEHPNFKCS